MKHGWKSASFVALVSASSVFAGFATTHAASQSITWLIRSDPIEDPWAKQVVAAFEKANPDISVNLMIIPQAQIDQKMQTMIAGGNAPDVLMPNWNNGGFSTYEQDLLNLSPYIKQDPTVLKGFIPKLVNSYNVKGQQLGIPILSIGSYLYYNKSMFKQAHIPFPTTNWNDKSWTWAKMVQDAKKLAKYNSNPTKMIFGVNDALWPENSDAWLWGGDYFSKQAYATSVMGTPTVTTSPGVRLGIQHHWNLIFKYKVAPTSIETTGMNALGDPFLTGRIAMEMNGGWMWVFKPAKFSWGVAALPQTVPGRRDVLFTDPVSIAKGSKNPVAAWKLVKFIVNPNGPLKWLAFDTSASPPQTQLLNEWYPFEAKQLGMSTAALKQLISGAFAHGSESANHLIFGYNTISSTLDQSLNAVYAGQMKIPDALQQMQAHLLALHLK